MCSEERVVENRDAAPRAPARALPSGPATAQSGGMTDRSEYTITRPYPRVEVMHSIVLSAAAAAKPRAKLPVMPDAYMRLCHGLCSRGG